MLLLVNIGGIILIGLVVYWFWLAKPHAVHSVSDVIMIVVDNGVYSPAQIEVALGKPTTLRFLRKDPSPCAEKVVFNDFGISADLDVNKETDVSLTPDKSGEFSFTCQMQMYRGTLIVK